MKRNLAAASLTASFLITLSLFISSCEKPDDTPGNNGGLTPFSVTVLLRTPAQAVIEWEPSTNLNINNGDTVKYKIFLNNNLVKTNRPGLRDTLTGLSEDTLYYGRVQAYTSDDTISAPFILNRINEYIVFHSEENFESYNLYSGVRMWQKNWGIWTHFDGSPTVTNDTVFFTNNQLSVGNTLFAAKLKTGAPVWSALPQIPGNLSVPDHTSPLYSQGKLYITGTQNIWALNSTTGQVIWNYPHPNSNTGTNPALANNKVFVGGQDHLVALNAATGTKLWDFPTGQTSKKILATDNMIIFGVGKKIYALNQATGTIAWERTFIEDTWNITPIQYGNLVIFFVDYDGFYAVNKNTGVNAWYRQSDWTGMVTATMGDNKYFYYDYSVSKLYALNAQTGTQLWEKANIGDTPSTDVGDIVYANKTIYCHAGNSMFGGHGLLAVINSDNGNFYRRTMYASDNIVTPTIRINDTVFYNAANPNFR